MLELRMVGGADPVWRLNVAGSFLARLRGLIGRPPPGPSEGLYLPGANSIHMLFMRFPIDCVFLGAPRADGLREVVGVREDLAPWRGVVWWMRGARDAVEVAAGGVAQAGLRRGDLVTLQDMDINRR